MSKSNFQAFRLLALGRSGTGKTFNTMNWTLNLIQKDVFKPKRVLLISKTWKSDPSQQELIKFCQSKYKKFKESNCFEDIDLVLLRKLFDTQKMIKETSPAKLKNWLVIFDDQISNSLIKRQSDATLKDFFCVGRHFNISQIWMLQRFKSTIDPTCRDQFTDIAIFKVPGKKQLQELLEDYDESPLDHKEGLKQLMVWYQEAVQDYDSHGCLVIHVLKNWGTGKIERNLGSETFYDIV